MSDVLRHLPLACPIDGLALASAGRSLVCGRGHAYDVSRFGYVNLLPVQFKPSKDPGDDAAMVAARRRVLGTGAFDALADAVAERVLACLDTVPTTFPEPPEPPARETTVAGASGRTPLLLDAGCGEGFHTARTAARVRRDRPGRSVHVLGADISVHAVRAAAKRHRDIGWIVANNTHLPVIGGAPDVITSLFGFETWEPWAALQREGQHVVVGYAGPRHLFELRRAIYETVRIHDPPSAEAATRAGYVVENERHVSFDAVDLPGERLDDLLAMTPHAHRARGDARAVRSALDGDTRMTMEVLLRTFRRC